MEYENNFRYNIEISRLWCSLISHAILEIINENKLTISDESLKVLENISLNIPDIESMNFLKNKALEETRVNDTIRKAINNPSLILNNKPQYVN
jgi:hypothetical protein